MSQATAIEWTDRTVNPIRARNLETGAVGHFCEKVSPGCANCYASTWNERVRPNGTHLIGTGLAFDARNRDKVEFFLDEKKLEEVLKTKKPTKFFWHDMTDLFGDWVPDEWIDRSLAFMAWTPWHTHQLLTKRADRMRAYFAGPWHQRVAEIYMAMREQAIAKIASDFDRQYAQGNSFACLTCGDHSSRFLPNVWLGVSVENQPYADERIPLLLQTPAAIRFISMEPLLGSIYVLDYLTGDATGHETGGPAGWQSGPAIDWGIAGGESGRGARGNDLAWSRDLVHQFAAAHKPLFMKQLGAQPFDGLSVVTSNKRFLKLHDRKGGDPAEWPEDLRVRQFPEPHFLHSERQVNARG